MEHVFSFFLKMCSAMLMIIGGVTRHAQPDQCVRCFDFRTSGSVLIKNGDLSDLPINVTFLS